jgi:hypothetical protein
MKIIKGAFIFLILITACSKGGKNINIPAGCNPVSLDDCFLPFPSSYYLKEDSSTVTGYRVNIPEGVLPVNADGVPLSPEPYNHADGFSPATALLAYFKEGIDSTTLPPITDIAPSITDASSIQILEFGTGERVPLFAELDANALEGDRQALIIRPMVRLKPATRYVAVIKDTVHNKEGNPLTPPEPFKIIRDGESTDTSELKTLQSKYKEIFEFLENNGVARQNIVLAWDFVTASDEFILSHMLKIRDEVLKQAGATGPGYSISKINEYSSNPSDANYDQNLWREIIGEFDVPSFLTNTEPVVLNKDENGLPVYTGRTYKAPFVVHIPQCAKTATLPLRVMIFGHGLFGSAEGEMDSGYEKSMINTLCTIQIGTDWVGLAYYDVPDVIVYTVRDLNYFNVITDRLQQAHGNAIMLARLVKGTFVKDPILSLEGPSCTSGCTQLADPDNPEIYYYGISDSAIQGTTFMTLTPDIERGALNVGGGPWSFMMFRSSDFPQFKMLIESYYPDRLDQQLLIALSQPLWDFTDPVTYGAHIIKDPLPDTPVKKIILQESRGDGQVPNKSTHILARTIGLNGLAPLVYPVFGITEVPGPIDGSAYTQWYVVPDTIPFPDDTKNIPPIENDAHEAIRRLPELIQQLDLFFHPDGKIYQTCPGGGPCVFYDEVMK